jgi:hypothetical protein
MNLDNLEPAPKLQAPQNFRPGIEFDGLEGTATTPGLTSEPENFDDFLRSAGIDPTDIEVIPPIRTSRWQQREGGDWLTSYRFTFRRKNPDIDLPLLMSEARKQVKEQKPKVTQEKALVICPSDFQVGKTGSRGGTKELIADVMRSYDRIEQRIKAGKYEQIYIMDIGDLIESFSSKANYAQLESNDLSPVQQLDVSISLMLDLVKRCAKYAPVTYGSVASNHCQNRFKGQAVGRPGVDDYGILILQQVQRVTKELGLDVTYLVPQPYDEGFAFRYGVNTIGVVHGHQASRPEGVTKWWANSTFGNQWVQPCDVLISGHFHHLRVEELGQRHDGYGSKFWLQTPTIDRGSDWWRLSQGLDSTVGILTFELDKELPFAGEVRKL